MFQYQYNLLSVRSTSVFPSYKNIQFFHCLLLPLGCNNWKLMDCQKISFIPPHTPGSWILVKVNSEMLSSPQFSVMTVLQMSCYRQCQYERCSVACRLSTVSSRHHLSPVVMVESEPNSISSKSVNVRHMDN